MKSNTGLMTQDCMSVAMHIAVTIGTLNVTGSYVNANITR